MSGGFRRRVAADAGPLALLAALCLAVAGAADEPPGGQPQGWTRIAHARKVAGNLTFVMPWQPDAGIRLLVTRRGTDESALLTYSPSHFAVTHFPGQGRPGRSLPVMQPVPPAAVHRHAAAAGILLKFRERGWLLYFDSRLVGRVPAPFFPPAEVSVETANHGAPTEVRFQPVLPSEISFRSDFMIEAGVPKDEQLSPWRAQSGSWRIHTALEDALKRPESDLDRMKSRPLTPDKSPNFYCLKGQGSKAIITVGSSFHDHYRYAAALHVNDGQAGLVFYYRDPANYYAYVLEIRPPPEEGGTLRLWKVQDGKHRDLARVKVPLYTDQWYRPEVRVLPDRITCLLDSAEIVSVEEIMPPGGSVGLFADAQSEVRFDDALLTPETQLFLHAPEHLNHHVLVRDGKFAIEPDEPSADGTPGQVTGVAIRPRRSRQTQRLIVGCPQHSGVVCKASFVMGFDDCGAGMIVGYRSDTESYRRFSMRRDAQGPEYRLEMVRPNGGIRVIDAWRPVPANGATSPTFDLTVDASEPGTIRYYHDSTLVFVTHRNDTDSALAGAAGITVAPRTDVVVRGLEYGLEREGQWIEEPQPNEVFEKDSFMRHWSSPEGQWLAAEPASRWFGKAAEGGCAVRLPLVDGAQVHLGVGEGWHDGRLQLRVRGNTLVLRENAADPRRDALAEVDSGPSPLPAELCSPEHQVTLHAEGHRAWITVAGRLILQHQLAGVWGGGRIRVSGLTDKQLPACSVFALPGLAAADTQGTDETDAAALSTWARIRRHTVTHTGSFFPSELAPPHSADDETSPDLRPARQATAQQLVLGLPQTRLLSFSARFAADTDAAGRFGIIAGYRTAADHYYRVVVSREDGGETVRLSAVLHDTERRLQQWRVPPSDETDAAETVLGIDASAPGFLRVYRNGLLVLVERLNATLHGAAGLHVGPDTSVTVRDLQYRHGTDDDDEPSALQPLHSGGEDWGEAMPSFMWHKGDFLGDFSVQLPCIDGARLEAGVRDGHLDGDVCVSVDGDVLRLRVGSPYGGEVRAQQVTLPAATPPAEGKSPAPRLFQLYCEGHWAWVSVDGDMQLKQRLPRHSLSGPRVRASGLTLAQMAHSRVRRHNVITDFFTETPHRWLVNGGDWQIINRFQCTPSWSHMIGESAKGMAALWHKSVFEGDLTLEFYAGTRHGYYHRPGDLNCTIMAETTAPDAGYSVTCTEWDTNHSQNWSTFYRKGEALGRSDKYLVPRVRKGSVRKFLNPLVSTGRPVHGAWYYIKLRRIGNMLEYYFDNERVFAHTDSEPLSEGLVGIWTFMHSMTVAQVKITFQKIRPRSYPVTMLPLAPDDVEEAVSDDATPAARSLTCHGAPVDSLSSRYWSVRSDAGHPRLEPFRMNAPALRVMNQLGSGRMLAESNLPAMPADLVAGWRLLIKRSARAPLNLHYSLGTVDSKGTYTASRRLFHRLTGTDFSDGNYKLTGSSELPASENITSAAGDWHEVTAWIPSRIRPDYGGDSNQHVRFESIGNRQPSALLCGIGGAFPDDGFSVRQLTPILYRPPVFQLQPDAKDTADFVVRKRHDRPELLRTQSIDELNRWFAEQGNTGLNTVWLQVRHEDGWRLAHEVAWVQLPDTVLYQFDWHPTRADTVQMISAAPFVDPRFAAATVSLAGKPLPLEPGVPEACSARIPRSTAFGREALELLSFAVDPGTGSAEETLEWSASSINSPPALVSLEGITPFFEGFESDTPSKRLVASTTVRQEVRGEDAAQGRHLFVQNGGAAHRLAASFSTGFSIAQYPILLFRYRAYDMVHLTAAFSNSHYVRLGDDYASARSVRLGHDLHRDGQWHTWLGAVSDAFTQQTFSTKRFVPSSMKFGSSGSPDQTGIYSKWNVDDIVFGPAVSSAEQLKFTPTHFDFDGIAHTLVAVSSGAPCHAELAEHERQQLTWRRFEPGKAVVPDITGLEDGVHHLFVKAADGTGVESSVTDLPFLLDRKPLTASHSFTASTNPASNGVQLTIAFNNDGAAPWDISKAKFQFAGTTRAVSSWTNLFVHSPAADTLHLNYPFLMRKSLDATKDGDTLELAIDGIMDGAGNSSERLVVPIKVDYAKDNKRGPAWYYLKFADTVHSFTNWEGTRSSSLSFTAGRYNYGSIVHRLGYSAYYRARSYYTTADISRTVDWKPAKHPWLSFRMYLPVYRAATTRRVALTTTSGKVYTISLGKPGSAATELNRKTTISWEAKTWKALSFDVNALLEQAGVSDGERQKLTVKTVSIQLRSAKHGEYVYFDDFFLHAGGGDAEAKDTMTWAAYDASGVASLELTCYGEDGKQLWAESCTGAVLNLKPLRGKASGKSWLSCRAKDKAGNLSVPMWLPFPQGG